MSYTTQLLELIDRQDGLVLTRDAETAGIPRYYLTLLAREGIIERVGHGVYLTPDTFEDDLYMLQARSPQLIFSHETALYLHDLTDRDPISYSVTVPTGYHNRLLMNNDLQVYTVKKEWHELGVTESSTVYGRQIRLYNAERTLCDLFRQRNKVDADLLNDSMKRYLTRKEKNIPQLLRYADLFRVSSPIRKYVEILL
ncbi:type IV toxin-antitoxin system AbiEi family antitoxin domain-containing protein [Planococcus sp. S3-L1]|uniref:type IV toxin-antitoxin system AbiEi family antitoxin domain-containing protein n=1 Tax=Planococcus sp. S3-L1 TaxID=3046200 RepID=UPI0024BAD9DA|nr:type IV toxin-antitoxin system AbiEi family antitoxin domain-containing protein [Planococcus sp. S3-L1]MDJ0332646.1 type IV toxin-antitoxin system AbiEi family antitoxin domain-containing protein [Planococcus sp. S3-L1]